MSRPTRINANAGFRYQVYATVPGDDGQLVTPDAGAVTGMKLRLSASRTGDALASDVDDLPATENAEVPGLFEVVVSQELHQTRVLPLGVNKRVHAIWSRADVADDLVQTFIIMDHAALAARPL